MATSEDFYSVACSSPSASCRLALQLSNIIPWRQLFIKKVTWWEVPKAAWWFW